MLHEFDAFDAAEENMENMEDANAAPSLCTLESAKRALLGDSPDTPEKVHDGAASDGKQKVEHLSNDFSMCSLLVSPLDLVNVGNWAKAAKEAEVSSPQKEHSDDNSSISTNWSLLADDLKVEGC